MYHHTHVDCITFVLCLSVWLCSQQELLWVDTFTSPWVLHSSIVSSTFSLLVFLDLWQRRFCSVALYYLSVDVAWLHLFRCLMIMYIGIIIMAIMGSVIHSLFMRHYYFYSLL